MSDRSFTVEAVYRGGKKVRFHGGRYISSSPAAAARKAFSQAYRHITKNKTPMSRLSLEIHVRETTQRSSHKTFGYRVTRVNQPVEVEHAGETVVHKYTTKVRAL
jgi:hypothetical protein